MAKRMKKTHFDQLLKSVHEMGKIRRGKRNPGRVTYRVKPATAAEVKEVRSRVLHLTQDRFAAVVGESLSAIRHWEQGLRNPSGAATKIIRLLKRHPERMKDLV